MKNGDHPVLGTLLLLVMLTALWPVLNFSNPKEAKAESQCPAPIPNTFMTIRTGSASGPIIGSYQNNGWNMESGDPEAGGTYASLSVAAGTVLYFSNWTEGVEATNRAPGSQHYISGGVTITSPGDLAGYYPSGFSVTKRQYAQGYTTPINSQRYMRVEGHNSCWGGFDDGISWIQLTITVSGGPAGPTTKQATNNLAIVKNPSVSLLVNGSPSATVPNGSTANFSWTTDSVNFGNSCVASNNNSDATWTGAKLGQTSYTPPSPPPASGGSQTVGPFPTNGTFTYNLYCTGLNGVISTTSSVTVNVGDPPTYTCVATPGTQQVIVGDDGTATIDVTPLNGYNTPITFSLGSITPGGKNVPEVTIDSTPQTTPYNIDTPVVISTTASTVPGTYQIVFTGTGGINCPPITFEVIQPAPDGEIRCDGALDSCTKSAGQSAQITWTSINVDSCEVSYNPPAVEWTGVAGSRSTGALASSRTYYLNCTGPYGPVVESVSVTVVGAIDAPAWVTGDNSVCAQVTVNWGAPSSGASPSYYRVYRRNQGDAGNGSVLHNTPNNAQFSYLDNTGAVGSNYQYGVSAIFGSTESNITWSIPVTVAACNASLAGSYKKIVGAGSTVPNMAGAWCSGAANAYGLPSGQVFQSGDTVYFEICANAQNSNVPQNNVTVTELLGEVKYLDNIEYISSGSNCVTSGSGSGPYLIGTMAPDAVCGILLKATIANPGGSTGVLRHFVNTADISSDLASIDVSVTEPFVVGSGEPTRTETPR